jgi:alpha-glucosidase (family GH31 glycosyl hydrolase)
MFSTSHSRGTYSVGLEIDGMWGSYKVHRHDYGGLEEYLIVGRTIREVVRQYADLVGYPLLVPRWAFGYLAGGMKYSMLDEPRACDALITFAEKLRERDIPCRNSNCLLDTLLRSIPQKHVMCLHGTNIASQNKSIH